MKYMLITYCVWVATLLSSIYLLKDWKVILGVGLLMGADRVSVHLVGKYEATQTKKRKK